MIDKKDLQLPSACDITFYIHRLHHCMDYKLLVLSSLWTVTYPVTSVMNLHLMARQAADEICIMQIDEGKL